ncbi:uncharacterized protein N7496_002539 [Penicillium cataractarum]|uniref:Short-chain dehydrogenase/reductase n=1 Tax=Penicillium cataractarum TaxID=2100454 RepID=A0A9W9VHY5_9EURO|nr:uncharacterized protein N7496_002539 [Penicillium cataractarum]KAJ5380111.1 hypothetical protein N7496_002539 [Penicillium cataractarum]
MGLFSKSVSFSPAKDIPSLEGKVILVTGGNNGLGKQSLLAFAHHNPSEIWLAARNLSKASVAADEIKRMVPKTSVRVLELDLASFHSIKAAANIFLSQANRLDILMLNAGIMSTPHDLTEDGYEIQFGTNHMGHALLTKLILPVLNKTAQQADADVRIVVLSSSAHRYPPTGGFVPDSVKVPDALPAEALYGQSKLANLLYVRQLAEHYPQFTIAAIHPGVVQTSLFRGATGTSSFVRAVTWLVEMSGTSVEKGVFNQLWASVSKDVRSGEYYEPVGVTNMAGFYGKDDKLAKKLWDWTEKELEGHA